MALTELSRFLPRFDSRNRYPRTGHHAAKDSTMMPKQYGMATPMDLPPGATFDPDPQSDFRQRDNS
jgi:putative (di)nucleoside polyphosphate hydrolase